MTGGRTPVKVSRASLPLPVSERNWSPTVLAAVCTSAGVATWSFVVGGSAASYLDAKMGFAAMLAGGLIAQFFITLATVPASTKFGIETVISTKPQLGSRGSYLALFMQYCTAMGWNCVLMLFFGRSAAAVLQTTGVIGPDAASTWATVFSVAGVIVVWLMLNRGARSLQKVGPVVAIAIIVLAIWLLVLLLQNYGASEISAAEPLASTGDRLLDYTSVVELLIVSTWGWWSYMGGMVRMVDKTRKAVLPSMLGLGVAWVLVAAIALYSTLVTGESDPSVWATEVAGDAGGIVVLVFIAMANLSSTLIGGYVASLGISQIPSLGTRLPWRAITALVLAPLFVIVIFFAEPFSNNIDQFMAFIGLMIAPVVGIQIADWFGLRRLKTLQVSALYPHNKTSRYWYFGGFNPAGIIALVAGSVTYQLMMNPVTYEPRSPLFKYITASLPAMVVAGLVYLALSWLMRSRLERVAQER